MREQTMSNKNICSECDSENSSSAKFCFDCGSELPDKPDEEISDTKACPGCGSKNDETANFCARCGHELAQIRPTARPKKPQHTGSRKKARSSQPAARSWNPIIIGLVLGGLIVIYLFAKDNNRQVSSPPGQFQPIIEQKTNNVELETKVIEVASKFACSCGSCGAEPLETCTCQTAQQERQFIREALQSGQTMSEVVFAVDSKYGWPKADQQNNPAASDIGFLQSMLSQNAPAGMTSTIKGNSRLAGFSDRLEIITHFSCTCGQCAIDELRDCSCDHPRGAKEVKQFIDNKIQAGTFTVDKIIELVDDKFGGRIR